MKFPMGTVVRSSAGSPMQKTPLIWEPAPWASRAKGQAWFQVVWGSGGRVIREPRIPDSLPCTGWKGSVESSGGVGLGKKPEEWWTLLPLGQLIQSERLNLPLSPSFFSTPFLASASAQELALWSTQPAIVPVLLLAGACGLGQVVHPLDCCLLICKMWVGIGSS